MIIKDVKIVNYHETIENADVEIVNDIILSIKPKHGFAKDILIPGFIDSHLHGYMGLDVMDSKKAVEKISDNLLKVGVTSFLPTVMTSKWPTIIETLQFITQSQKRQIVGINLEGPFISSTKKGAHEPKYLLKPTIEHIEALVKASQGKLRKITFAPEEATNLSAIIDVMLKHKIIPSIGHTNGDNLIIKKAIEHGSTSATHLWNAMTGVNNRNPGTAQIVLNSSSVFAEIICDLIHVDLETIILTINAKTPKKLIVVSDAIRPSGLENGEYESGSLKVTKNGQLITLKNTSTIAGSGSTVYDGFKNLCKLLNSRHLNLTLNDIVAMTSYNVAKHFNLEKVGKIAPNFYADLVILDQNHEIVKVISKGKSV